MREPKFSRADSATADQPWAECMPSRRTRERTAEDAPVTRAEFGAHRKSACEWRKDIGEKINNIESALFSKDDKNEHGQVGLMVIARKLDQHIDAVCNIAKWIRNSVIAVCTMLAAIGGAGKAFGWW